MTDAAIETVDLAKRYGRIDALVGLTMRVERGSVFGFLGPNGAGKTTAVKLLLGLAQPTSGEAVVLGARTADRRAHREARRRVGYLPELFRYQGWLTAREVLDAHCALIGVARGEREAQVAGALATVGLAARATDRVQTFSKGMQQRLGLAVALLGDPELVILDEHEPRDRQHRPPSTSAMKRSSSVSPGRRSSASGPLASTRPSLTIAT